MGVRGCALVQVFAFVVMLMYINILQTWLLCVHICICRCLHVCVCMCVYVTVYLYCVCMHTCTSLPFHTSAQMSPSLLQVPSQGDQEGRGQAIAEIEHNQEQAQVQNGAQANAWNHGRVQTNGENQKAAKVIFSRPFHCYLQLRCLHGRSKASSPVMSRVVVTCHMTNRVVVTCHMMNRVVVTCHMKTKAVVTCHMRVVTPHHMFFLQPLDKDIWMISLFLTVHMHVYVTPYARVCYIICTCMLHHMHVYATPCARVCYTPPYAHVCYTICTCMLHHVHVYVTPYAHVCYTICMLVYAQSDALVSHWDILLLITVQVAFVRASYVHISVRTHNNHTWESTAVHSRMHNLF